MNKKAFEELLSSVREGGAILRGEKKPARVFTFSASQREGDTQENGLVSASEGVTPCLDPAVILIHGHPAPRADSHRVGFTRGGGKPARLES